MVVFIAVMVFFLVAVLFVPSTWFEANVVKKRLNDAPKNVSIRSKGTLKRLTPMVINMMTMFNIRLSSEQREETERKLELSGKEQSVSVEDFMTMKVVSTGIVFLYFVFLGWAGEHSIMFLLAFIIAPLGFFLPDQWLKQKTRQRQDQIRKKLPYTLNAISIMSEAGLNLIPAMKEAAAKQEGELSKELSRVVHDVSVGISQVKALERMAHRCQVDEVNRFVSALAQSIERGASGMTQVLREQAREVWEARKKKAQQLGEQASMKLFFPLLLLAFPATTIFILGPAILSIVQFVMSYE